MNFKNRPFSGRLLVVLGVVYSSPNHISISSHSIHLLTSKIVSRPNQRGYAINDSALCDRPPHVCTIKHAFYYRENYWVTAKIFGVIPGRATWQWARFFKHVNCVVWKGQVMRNSNHIHRSRRHDPTSITVEQVASIKQALKHGYFTGISVYSDDHIICDASWDFIALLLK